MIIHDKASYNGIAIRKHPEGHYEIWSSYFEGWAPMVGTVYNTDVIILYEDTWCEPITSFPIPNPITQKGE